MTGAGRQRGIKMQAGGCRVWSPDRAAARTKGSYDSALYSRIARRHMLTTGAFNQDPGADYFERRHDPAVEAKRLQRKIEALGFSVTISDKAA